MKQKISLNQGHGYGMQGHGGGNKFNTQFQQQQMQQQQMLLAQQQQQQKMQGMQQWGDEEGYGVDEEGNFEIDLDQITESMIMQEDIDENYEPTQDEVIEYARFLGMDMIQDKDLFYVAREGLKAPLPEPWRPVKHPSGEMFYLNLETREVSWDHPCDSYYQELYRKEKEKKVMKQSQMKIKQFQQMEEEYTNQTVAAVTGKSKKALPVVMPKHDIFSKKNDPLIKVTQEKKINEYRTQQKQKLQDRKKEIDELYKKKFTQLEEQHKQKLDKIKEDYEDQKANEEEKLQNKLAELQDDEQSDKERAELERYEVEIRAELKKTNKTRLDAEKKDFEMRLQTYKLNIHNQYEDQLLKRKDEIRIQHEKRMKEMEKEEQDLRNDARFVEFNEEEELEMMKRKFLAEQEEKFTRDREAMKRKYQDQLRAFKETEMEKHRSKLDALYANVSKEKKIQDDFDEHAYRTQLEDELSVKMKNLQAEMDNKFELEKLNILAKLKDYEVKKKDDFERKLDAEVKLIEAQWAREKEKKDQEFNLQKSKIEQKALEEYLTFKAQFEKQILNEEKRIRDLFNSEQEMKNEKEKISSTIILKLQNELQGLTEQCEKLKRENEESKERQKELKTEIEGKRKVIEFTEKEKQLLEEIADKDKVITQLKQQIDELDDQDINLELNDIYSHVKLNQSGLANVLIQNSRHLQQQQQQQQQQHHDIDSGYSSDGSAVANFNDNKDLQSALHQVSSEIDKEKQKLLDEKLQINHDLSMLSKEFADHGNNLEKKQFLLSMRSRLETRQLEVERKLKHLIKMNGIVPKDSGLRGRANDSFEKTSAVPAQNNNFFKQQGGSSSSRNNSNGANAEPHPPADMSSKFLSDYNSFLSKYKSKV